MVATQSTMLELGTKMPRFSLQDTVSQTHFNLEDHDESKAYVISFICNHCPYVLHLLDHLVTQFNEWVDQGLCVVAICSNDQMKYPADGPDEMTEIAQKHKFRFPYLHDETQKVAKCFTASCTPDFFLFGQNKELFYRGQYDCSRPSSEKKCNWRGFELCGQNIITRQKPAGKANSEFRLQH